MAERTCSIEGCDKPHSGRGWCKAHYMRWRNYGDPLAEAPLRPRILSDLCSVPGCSRSRTKKSNGARRSMCIGHYKRFAKYGDTQADVPIGERRDPSGGHLSSYGYWVDTSRRDHPLTRSDGVLQHRAVLYDHIGPGAHPCHWCSSSVDWADPFPLGLVVDHLDGDRLNNDLSNLLPSCQPCNGARATAGNPLDWTPKIA